MAVLARAPRCRSHRLPVGRSINRAAKTLPLNEGLQQHHGMSILGSPVPGNPPSHSPQNPAPQVGHTTHGKIRKRELLAISPRLLCLCWADQPMKRSRS